MSGQYTVYAYYPDALGEDFADGEDLDRLNELLEGELEARKIEHARIIYTEDAGKYTLQIPPWREDLIEARDAAVEQFYHELNERDYREAAQL